MKRKLLSQYEMELIREIALTSNGIGQNIAGYLAAHYCVLSKFIGASANDLHMLKRANGGHILSLTAARKLATLKEEYRVIKKAEIREAWVYFLATRFTRNQVALLNKFSFEELDINPFLAKVLHLKTSTDVIRFNLYQSVTRSAVTSWGNTIEKILKYSGCELDKIDEGRKGRRPDLKKVWRGRKTYFQIKSGPNTMNVDMIESLNEVLDGIEKRGDYAFLGMTYGTRARISPQILGNLKNANKRTKIGRELWDFISEEANYHLKIIKVLDRAAEGELDVSFSDLIEKKIIEFDKEWKRKNGKRRLNKALEKYI